MGIGKTKTAFGSVTEGDFLLNIVTYKPPDDG